MRADHLAAAIAVSEVRRKRRLWHSAKNIRSAQLRVQLNGNLKSHGRNRTALLVGNLNSMIETQVAFQHLLASEPGLDFTKSYQSTALLVPKSQTPTSEAPSQGDNLGDSREFRSGGQARLKPVVGDPGAQVVHVVQADITGEPLQDWRKLKVRAADDGRFVEVPITVA